jgi:hypothetical protein
MFFTTSRQNLRPNPRLPLPNRPAFAPPDPAETIWSAWPPLKRWRRRLLGCLYRLPDTGWFGLTPLRDHVVICGYPRSGTTLLLAMMEHAIPDARRFGEEIGAWRAATYARRNHAAIVSKKPDDLFALHRVRNFYAGRRARLHVIVMVRDPRDVLTSRHFATGPAAYFEDVAAWRARHDYVRHYRNDPGVLTVRYEDLVDDTPAVRRRVERFTGIASEHAFVDFHHRSFDEFDTRALNGVRPVDRGNVGRWRDPEHRDRIEQVLREVPDFCDILMEMGYEPNADWVDAWRREGAVQAGVTTPVG